MEKRKHERYEELSDIVYTESGKESYSNAKMGNCSMGGMFFNSKSEIAEGTDLCVKMLGYRSVFNAKVVRCLKVADVPGTKFGIGIKYLNEVSSV